MTFSCNLFLYTNVKFQSDMFTILFQLGSMFPVDYMVSKNVRSGAEKQQIQNVT